MDVAELIPLGVVASIVLAAGAGWWLAGRSVSPRGRRGVRVVAAVIMAGALSMGAVLIYFDVNYTRHLAPVISPDGRHRAITSYTVNTGTGADEAEVVLRRSWNPFGTRVYVGPAKFRAADNPPEPEVVWIDDAHLAVRFHAYASSGEKPYAQGCATSAIDIEIRCEETLVHATR